MINIRYTGLSENIAGQLKDKEGMNVQPFQSIDELLSNLEETDLVIFGQGAIRLSHNMQKVHKQNKDISILVITNKNDFQKICSGLKFLPFLSQNYKCISESDGVDIASVAQDHGRRTQQRRSFRKLKDQTGRSTPSITLSYHPAPQYLSEFMDQAPIGMFLLDKNRKILALNNQAIQIFGISEASAYDQKFNTFIVEEEQQNLDAVLENLGQKRTVKHKEQYLEISASKVKEEEDVFCLVLVQDITLRMQIDLQLKEKLREVERVNKELEQVAYILSHDLKNPLVPMKSYCELAQRTNDVEKKNNYLKKIETSTEHMRQQIEGLEALIDLERKHDNTGEEIDLRKLIKDLMMDFEKQLEEQKGQVKFDLQVKTIHYIKPYITSILSNFISNALKYSKSGRPLVLTVSTEDQGDFVLMKFADNGIGIDLEKHGKDIFKPYNRFTEQATGRGVGLSLVKKMIEKNGGSVEVESQPGKGSTFICCLREY